MVGMLIGGLEKFNVEFVSGLTCEMGYLTELHVQLYFLFFFLNCNAAKILELRLSLEQRLKNELIDGKLYSLHSKFIFHNYLLKVNSIPMKFKS